MASLRVLCCAVLALSIFSACVFTVTAADTPVLRPWPAFFQSNFIVNKISSGLLGVPGIVHYDEMLGQRTDYTVKCAFGGDPSAPCTIQMTPANAPNFGIFLLTGPQRDECCVLFPTLGSFPRNWTQVLDYSGDTYAYGRPVQAFTDGGPAPHTLYVEAGSQTPVFISPEMWQWQTGYVEIAQNPALFKLPSSCASRTPCASSSSFTHKPTTPFF
mmetsp:Transcript_630/g.1451  ORF Transcript_630/g.1451 Transcript_630/m.1451 type:complete len:215 (-) Transcript_630:74-718(-)|eukprot:CAMPEP_0177653448 /NCGR_PEP_ID=MMETSP0447-20121125/13740_1 /TAXON_ID=0 /ORGANISM="Stygamoeba regulata, Strain BSH-02190019" /LENGTH=214 /DNA_ID=CAMNT_0019156903 /DNA_START=213 /DNA_END=857 /DNA_ORIENTATION=-